MKLNVDFSQLQNLVVKMKAKPSPFVPTNLPWGEHVDEIGNIKTNKKGQPTDPVTGKISLLYIQKQQYGTEYKFHIAICSTLSQSLNAGSHDKYVITTKREKFKIIRKHINRKIEYVAVELKVCRHCLEALNYKNYNRRTRLEKDEIYENFDIQKYLKS